MPRFVFHLEGVLRHRTNVERQRQRELAVAQAQFQQLQIEMRQLQQSVQDAVGDLRTNRLVGALDLSFLTAHRRFIASMQQKAIQLAQRMQLAQREVDRRREALVAAAKDRKVIEKLREKQLERWRADMGRREVEELDEIGMQLSYRHSAGLNSSES